LIESETNLQLFPPNPWKYSWIWI